MQHSTRKVRTRPALEACARESVYVDLSPAPPGGGAVLGGISFQLTFAKCIRGP